MDKAGFYFPPCSDSFYSCFALFLLGKSFSCDLQRNTGSAGCSSAADRIGQLKTFLKESPRAVRAWLALADEYGREGQYKEALNAMNEAFSVSPNGVAKTADYRVQRAVFALRLLTRCSARRQYRILSRP